MFEKNRWDIEHRLKDLNIYLIKVPREENGKNIWKENNF